MIQFATRIIRWQRRRLMKIKSIESANASVGSGKQPVERLAGRRARMRTTMLNTKAISCSILVLILSVLQGSPVRAYSDGRWLKRMRPAITHPASRTLAKSLAIFEFVYSCALTRYQCV